MKNKKDEKQKTKIDISSDNETEGRIKSVESLFGILSDDITLEKARNEYIKGKYGEPNSTTFAAIETAESGEDMYGPFDSVDELMKALND